MDARFRLGAAFGFELVVELVIARQEEPDERTRSQLIADGVYLGELLAAAKDFEKRLGVRLGFAAPRGDKVGQRVFDVKLNGNANRV